MVRTRAQRAAEQEKRWSSATDQGKRPQGIARRRSRRHTKTRPPQEQPARKPTVNDRIRPALFNNTQPQQPPPAPTQSRGRKRPADDARDPSPDTRPPKRLRNSPIQPCAEDTLGVPAANGAPDEPSDPVAHWVEEGCWPEKDCWPEEASESQPTMERLLARKKPVSALSRKRSNSATSTTPSDQKPREGKSAQYRSQRYETLLETKGSWMAKSSLDIDAASKTLCRTLLETRQTVPKSSLFSDDRFESTCLNIHNRNEARVIQDIIRLIVPSAEALAFDAKQLDILTESLNEGWSNSIPLTEPRPQPHYSVGFRRGAFTDDQLAKLSPFIGDFIAGDQSFFMATYYMYFPFLTCEVKCGAAALDIADRQNAHSMHLAVRAPVELFRLVKREKELHRQILAFSVSHDHRTVRIYGHYPVIIDGKDPQYYRHPIHTFDFTALDGKDKWTAYQFTKNVYQHWMPAHFKNICSAIDQLPSELDFDIPSLQESGPSQSLESYHLPQSGADCTPDPIVGGTESSSIVQQELTPDTSRTGQGPPKRSRPAKKK